MTATYPDEAIFDLNVFPILGSATYNNTSSQTQFALATAASFPGEVLAISDGVVQNQQSYELVDSGLNVSFFTNPNASELILRNLAISSAFTKTANISTIVEVTFSNTVPVIIDSNTYVVDGVRTDWALPTQVGTEISKDTLLVTISGAVQNSNAYVFPSSSLTTEGIDITPAVTANDSIFIKAFISDFSQVLTCTSMVDRKPDKGIESAREFSLSTFESIAGYEKTRLTSRRSKRSWTISYANITGVHKKAIENFYIARNGPTETFIFDLAHISEDGTAFTRFLGPLQISQNHILGETEAYKYYTVSFRLKEVFG